MRKYLLAAVVMAGGASAAADEIDDMCRERWGTDYVMREYCVTEQRAARSRVLQTQEISPEALRESMYTEAIGNLLRQRGIWRQTHAEIEAIAATNADAAHYVECERGTRTFADGKSRLKRITDCLMAGASR